MSLFESLGVEDQLCAVITSGVEIRQCHGHAALAHLPDPCIQIKNDPNVHDCTCLHAGWETRVNTQQTDDEEEEEEKGEFNWRVLHFKLQTIHSSSNWNFFKLSHL
ncbi:hypothetical protein MRB53_008973 [Persea americana]|uniref:Uncharacterized protein n=1 Tax=Persea americana TaxID=3435 RepID=A0ACC2LMN0_PERAE|nr:hypothetical protein MRB53_008973 [Persea americana]